MLLGIAICMSASFWQYQKSVFYQAPVAQTLHMQGQFLNEHNYYLDNQTLDGKVGYAVITPFLYDGQFYLVNRGFIAYAVRDTLPKINEVKGVVQIDGILKQHHKPLLLNNRLQDPVRNRIQFIDEKYFSQLLHANVSSEIFIQQSGDGLLSPQPQNSSYLSHHRHQAYAVQWLLLGICGIFILFIASLKRGNAHA